MATDKVHATKLVETGSAWRRMWASNHRWAAVLFGPPPFARSHCPYTNLANGYDYLATKHREAGDQEGAAWYEAHAAAMWEFVKRLREEQGQLAPKQNALRLVDSSQSYSKKWTLKATKSRTALGARAAEDANSSQKVTT